MENIFLLLFFTSYISCEFNKTDNTRGHKTFSLFSVVQFPNDVCTSTSGTYSNGTCITSSECASRGGTTSGSCAAGFGVCCIYTYSTTGDVISQNVSYLVNPNYPSNYAPTNTPATVTYTINKCSCDVCRLRLDFEDFQLTSPTTANPWGLCTTDYMTLKTTAHTVTPASTGNYGNYPYMCGTNSGQHAYIDMSCTCSDTATIDFVLGDTTNNQWKIKVTQLSCDDPDVASTEGCFQYFTAESGSFESFGLASSTMICGHNYNVCIRPLEGYCCIEYTPTTWSVNSWNTETGATTTCTNDDTDAGDNCIGAIACQRNFVIFPGAQSEVTSNAAGSLAYIPPNGLERYCGTLLVPEGNLPVVNPAQSTPVTTCQRPFRVTGVTGDCGTPADSSTASTGVSLAAGSSREGWAFTYRQLPGTC